MKKFRQLEEARSAKELLNGDLHNVRDKDLEESLKSLEINSTGIGREGVKKAFIRSVKRYHPDFYHTSNTEARELAEERTKKIIEAYKNIVS